LIYPTTVYKYMNVLLLVIYTIDETRIRIPKASVREDNPLKEKKTK